MSAGPMPGQHADGGAEQHADEREEQVHRLDGDGEAVGEGDEGVHGGPSEQAFERADGQGQGEKLGEKKVDHERRARTPMRRSVEEGAAAEAGRDAPANRIAVAGMKPPPKPMSAMSAARPPRMQDESAASRGSRAAGRPPRKAHDGVADREQREPGRDDDRHRLGPEAVDRGELRRDMSQNTIAGEGEETECDDEAGRVDAPAGGHGGNPSS